MRRNVAGQFIGCQLISKTDGSAVTTGTTTVYVTGDAGTQAAGSVGSGACTHEGNGFWTYAPAQAETNYTHVGFTFVNTSAVNATVQVFPMAYDSSGQATVGAIAANAIDAAALASDAGTELATAVWASGTRSLTVLDEDSTTLDLDATIRAALGMSSADLDTQLAAIAAYIDTEVAAIKAETATILSDTNDIQTRLPAALVSGRMDSSVGAMAANVITAAATAADYLAEINAEADAALADVGLTTTITGRIDVATSTRLASASYTAPLDAAGTRSAVGLASANLDSQLDALPTAAENATAIWAAASRTLTALDEDSTTLDLDATIRAAVGLAAANLDTQLADLPTAGENADAVWDEAIAGHAGAGSTGEALAAAGAAGDPWITALPGSYSVGQAGYIVGTCLDAAVSDVPTATENADALLNRDMSAVSDTNSRSPLNALRHIRNKWSLSGTTLTVTKENDSTTAWTATVTTNAAAEPITGSDPA